MLVAIAWPCAGPGSKVRRMSRSSVPCKSSTRSPGVDILGEATRSHLGCQGETEFENPPSYPGSSSSFAFFHQPVRRWSVRCAGKVSEWPLTCHLLTGLARQHKRVPLLHAIPFPACRARVSGPQRNLVEFLAVQVVARVGTALATGSDGRMHFTAGA
jgi:hypothetical protein